MSRTAHDKMWDHVCSAPGAGLNLYYPLMVNDIPGTQHWTVCSVPVVDHAVPNRKNIGYKCLDCGEIVYDD